MYYTKGLFGPLPNKLVSLRTPKVKFCYTYVQCLPIRTIQDFWCFTSTPFTIQHTYRVQVPSTHWILLLGALVFQPFHSLPQSTKGAKSGPALGGCFLLYSTVLQGLHALHTQYMHLLEHLMYIACRGDRSVSALRVYSREDATKTFIPQRHSFHYAVMLRTCLKATSGTPVCNMYVYLSKWA